MAKRKTKKVNPRRIPLPKREISQEAILEEATKDDLYQAWLLVFHALMELELIPFHEIPDMTERVNLYIRNSDKDKNRREESKRAERMMGIPFPKMHIGIDSIRSAVELEAFKRKVKKIAIYTALSVLYLGLESTGRFHEKDLQRVFFHADLTVAEIDHGIVSYKELDDYLANCGIQIERESDDLNHAHFTGAEPCQLCKSVPFQSGDRQEL